MILNYLSDRDGPWEDIHKNKKGHKNIKIKIFMFVSAKFQSEIGAFHHSTLVGNYHTLHSDVFALSHTVNGILLVRSAQYVGHEGWCYDFGGF